MLFVVPGWLALRRAGVDPLIALYAGLGVGALAGAAIVALGVLLPWSVRATCVGGAVIAVVTSVFCGVTAPRPLLPPRADLAGMVVFVVAFVSMASFSAVPSRPFGLWSADTVGPGRVDTPRWPGLPADNTLPFRTGQVALYKQGGANIRDLYSVGWWLSDRTPLTGLDFAFAAGALGVHVSSENVEDEVASTVPMEITDNEGFWCYQVVAVFLNLAIILGVYLLTIVMLGRRAALVAGLVCALMPGLFLNGIYTWPKQAVAYFVLIAAACALRRKPVLAGVFAGLGYLTHPAGLFWIPSVGLVLLGAPELRAHVLQTLVRFVTPVAALAAPWVFFTSQIMHAVSRWTTAPFGYLMADPRHFGAQLSIAWHDFLNNGILFAVWTRIQSTAASLFPVDLNTTPAYLRGAGGFGPQIMVAWSAGHGFSIWGMAGIVLFPFTLVFAVRDWRRFRQLALRFVVPAVVFAELANGEAYPFANQSMFSLVGVLAIVVGFGLLEVGRRTRFVILVFVCLELLTMVYGGLYRPFDIGAADAAVLTTVAVAGQLGLIATLTIQLDPVRRRRLRAAFERPVLGSPTGSARTEPGG